jgi:RNA-directed DNA polymerase
LSASRYRPGRSAQQAVQAARRYVREGRRSVGPLDRECFSDAANHDVPMSKVENRVWDCRVRKLIRRYLEA